MSRARERKRKSGTPSLTCDKTSVMSLEYDRIIILAGRKAPFPVFQCGFFAVHLLRILRVRGTVACKLSIMFFKNSYLFTRGALDLRKGFGF